MKSSMGMSPNLAATLFGTVAGTGAWLSGFSKFVWPAHPMIFVFLFTLVTAIVVYRLWPDPRRKLGA
jgi:hypothetical protein